MPNDCEVNVLCQITNIKNDVLRLFDRTDDINEALEECCGGDTTPPPPSTGTGCGWITVTNEQQLLDAVQVGGEIMVVGEILMTREIVVTKPGTRIYGRSGPGTLYGKILRPSTFGQVQTIIIIKAPRVRLIGLEITANNPLDPLILDAGSRPVGGQRFDFGIYIHPEGPSENASDCIIESCYIHNVTIGIDLQASGSNWIDRLIIRNNRIESFNFEGMRLDTNMRNLAIEGNWIWGRKQAEQHPSVAIGVTESHIVPGNGIWIGNYAQRCMIRFNDVAHCDRHGIEIVNNPSNSPESNSGAIIVGNNVHDLVSPVGNSLIGLTFGISVHAGGSGIIIGFNHIRNTTGYGIEIFNNVNFQGGHYTIIGNHILNVTVPSVYPAVVGYGIAVHSCTGALITGNYIEKIQPGAPPSVDVISYGICVSGGQSIEQPNTANFIGVKVSNNKLVDAGMQMIVINGNDLSQPADCSTVINNEMIFTRDRRHPTLPINNLCTGILVSNCRKACVVKDNIVYYPEDDPPISSLAMPFTGFDFINSGTVYTGDAIEAPIVRAAPYATNRTPIGGSNLPIPY